MSKLQQMLISIILCGLLVGLGSSNISYGCAVLMFGMFLESLFKPD